MGILPMLSLKIPVGVHARVHGPKIVQNLEMLNEANQDMICNPELEGNLELSSYCIIARWIPLSEKPSQNALQRPYGNNEN